MATRCLDLIVVPSPNVDDLISQAMQLSVAASEEAQLLGHVYQGISWTRRAPR